MKNREDWEDEEMALDYRETKKANVQKSRKDVIRNLANKVAERNDEALQRLSKN